MFGMFVVNQSGTTEINIYIHSTLQSGLKLRRKTRLQENNLGGDEIHFQGLFMTHSEKTRCPPTEAPALIGQLADFATLYRESSRTTHHRND